MSESPDRIIEINLDENSIKAWSPDVDHERKVAIFDLLEQNFFQPVGERFAGPYIVNLAVIENRLYFEIMSADRDVQGHIILALSPFRKIVREYFQVCETYFTAIKTASPSRIEAIDMGRRGLHNQGSELLVERLKDKINVDHDTARRLFTLICVLHIRA